MERRQLSVRLSAEELAAVEEAAARAGLTLRGYVSAAAVASARGRRRPGERGAAEGVRPERELLLALGQLRAELRAIGVNVNQVARAANTTGVLPPDLAEALAEVRSASRAVVRTTARVTAPEAEQ